MSKPEQGHAAMMGCAQSPPDENQYAEGVGDIIASFVRL